MAEDEKTERIPVGRLAMRVEGKFWVAYFAKPSTMEGALMLGALAMRLACQEKYRERFLDMMASIATDMIEDVTGRRPSYSVWTPALDDEPAGGNA